jgi:hypothetical protein
MSYLRSQNSAIGVMDIVTIFNELGLMTVTETSCYVKQVQNSLDTYFSIDQLLDHGSL